jgi:hypothetical protein
MGSSSRVKEMGDVGLRQITGNSSCLVAKDEMRRRGGRREERGERGERGEEKQGEAEVGNDQVTVK